MNTMRLPRKVLSFLLVLALVLATLAPLLAPRTAYAAPGDVVDCTMAQNLSKTPGFSSADPLLLADQTGTVHLFWAERTGGQANSAANVPDTVMYSAWHDGSWSQPIDLFLSPPERFNKVISGIRGIIDDQGRIHLIWIGPDNLFFYSQVHASQASLAGAWQEPLLLGSDQTGTQHSVDIAYGGDGTLHIAYARGNTANNDSMSVGYRKSTDSGATWTEPVDLYLIPYQDRGASNVRLLAHGVDDVYATWTEWDSTGNGQGVYFIQSNDSGSSWKAPILLDVRVGDEYERDWVTLAVLGEDELVAFWEGGWRAYRQAQYSYDGGLTWTDPADTLDWLIADNGFAEFVRDSAGRLHLFVFQRVREGNPEKGDRTGLWHTMWEGERSWREPELVGEQTPGIFVTVANNLGNQFFAAWFSTTDYEIYVRQCLISDAPPIEAVAWPIQEGNLEAEEMSEPAEPEAEPVEAAGSDIGDNASEPPRFTLEANGPAANDLNPSTALVYGLAPTLFLILVAFVVALQRQRKRR